MSRKQPEIKVIYPDASAAAMLLTDAMIRRSTGKRVVETNSEEKEYTGEQLFGGVLSTKTDTSVELTLRLNPDAMDYALTMLVAKNLTEEEKRAIRMETDSMEIVELLSAHAAGAAGAGTCTDTVGSAERAADGAPTQRGEQEKQIEIGKISDAKLREILRDLIKNLNWSAIPEDVIKEKIEETILDIDHAAGVIDLDETYEKEKQIEIGKMEAVDLRRIITDLQDDMVNHRGDHIEIAHRAFDAICEAAHMTKHDFAVDTGEDEEESDTWLTAMLATLIHLACNSKASKKNRARDIAFDFLNREEIGIPDSAWTTCAAIDKALEEAYKIAGAINKADRGQVDADELLERLLHEMNPDEYPMEESVQLDKADEAESEQDGEIDAGLLNDIDTEGEDHG